MERMDRELKISYHWTNQDEIEKEHIEALEESARDRIFEMLKEGYVAGELNDNIRMTDDDPEDGIEYRGWWSLVNF